MSRLGALLDEYEESHRHPVNVAIHWVAEPLAIFALVALYHWVNIGGISMMWPFLLIMLAYFAWLSWRIALAFLPIATGFAELIALIDRSAAFETWTWALPLFAISWLTLLIGHRIEGRSPSVFQNPNLIFVGPAWLGRIIFRKLGWPDP